MHTHRLGSRRVSIMKSIDEELAPRSLYMAGKDTTIAYYWYHRCLMKGIDTRPNLVAPVAVSCMLVLWDLYYRRCLACHSTTLTTSCIIPSSTYTRTALASLPHLSSPSIENKNHTTFTRIVNIIVSPSSMISSSSSIYIIRLLA